MTVMPSQETHDHPHMVRTGNEAADLLYAQYLELGDQIADALIAVGAPYGMAVTDVAAYLLLGERRHGDAAGDVCGAVDPRDEAAWCRLSPEHPGEGGRECGWFVGPVWKLDGETCVCVNPRPCGGSHRCSCGASFEGCGHPPEESTRGL